MYPGRRASRVPAMRRTTSLALLAVLALPASALAAPAKISPKAVDVSPTGAATIEAANPNAYAVSGKATLSANGRTIASRHVRLGKRSVGAVSLRLSDKAREALDKSRGRATLTLRLGRAGGRRTTVRRTLTFRAASEEATPAPAGTAPAPAATPAAQAPAAAPGSATPAAQTPAAPATTRFIGRMGTEGAYDDFEATVENGQMQITKAPFVPVFCLTVSPAAGSTSFELFDAPGPWTIGSDGAVEKKGIAVNQLVGSGERDITYKVTETTQDASAITGKLGMLFSGLKWNYATSTYIPVSCSGTQSFEAVRAP
jgi:hypothetical protein